MEINITQTRKRQFTIKRSDRDDKILQGVNIKQFLSLLLTMSYDMSHNISWSLVDDSFSSASVVLN